jgi:hypothetical protein
MGVAEDSEKGPLPSQSYSKRRGRASGSRTRSKAAGVLTEKRQRRFGQRGRKSRMSGLWTIRVRVREAVLETVSARV